MAASAHARGAAAVEDAVSAAVGELGGDRPSLVLVFPAPGSTATDAAARASSVVPPGCRIAGMTSDVTITTTGVRDGGCAALAFGSEMAVGVGMSTNASADLREAGRAAVREALHGLAPAGGGATLLLLLDPMSGDEGIAIDGAYSVVGARMPLAGGGANGAEPLLFAGEASTADAVVAVVLSSPAPVGVGIADGCSLRGDPAIATRTDGRVVREINGRPAEDVYLEGLGRPGDDLDDDSFEALAVLHPIAQPELRGLFRLRHVLGRAEGGGLACATAIPSNAALCFTEQTADSIVESVGWAVREALDDLGGAPRAALIFDCAARKRALGTALAEEAAALVADFDGVPALTGLYTRGEVGRKRGAKGDRNHAVVVVAFG